MYVNILYDIKETPWGGANQFLKGLKQYFISQGIYTDDPKRADILLFNSHHDIHTLLRIKRQGHNGISIHRIAGPIEVVRNCDSHIDKFIFRVNKHLADGNIFQSEWSRLENYRLGLKSIQFETIIMNAPDPTVFNKDGKHPFSMGRKIRLIATSWSPNPLKGFQVYQWLDHHLDFEQFEMTFIGNSPNKFQHIHHLLPISPQELGRNLKNHDIFIFASRVESCSNALLEAMHCGLPVIAFDGSSNPDIVRDAGLLFRFPEEIPALLQQLIREYAMYQQNIRVPSLEEVGQAYYTFMRTIYEAVQQDTYAPKKLTIRGYLDILGSIAIGKVMARCRSLNKITAQGVL
jgi:glycosyltransferase involved in cell wall biosynthesis